MNVGHLSCRGNTFTIVAFDVFILKYCKVLYVVFVRFYIVCYMGLVPRFVRRENHVKNLSWWFNSVPVDI